MTTNKTLLQGIEIPKGEGEREAKVTVPVQDKKKEQENEPFSWMERKDEENIIGIMEGRDIENYVYEYCRRHNWVDGKRPTTCNCIDTIIGLSYMGVLEASRLYGHLQIPIKEVQRIETDTHIIYLVQVIDTATGSSRVAVSRQAKKMKLHTGQYIDDEFAEVKALSKAQRNGLRQLIPQTIIKSLINKYRIANLSIKSVEQRIRTGFQQLKITPEEQTKLRLQYSDPRNLLNYLLNLASQQPTEEKEIKPKRQKEVEVDTKENKSNVNIVDMINELEINAEFSVYLQTFGINTIEDLPEIELQVVSQTLKQFYDNYISHLKTKEEIKQELLKIVNIRKKG